MSTNPNNAVGTNAAYDGRTSVKAFNDNIGAYSTGILSGWACSPDTGMTVSLGGDGTTRDIAIAEDVAGNKITVNNISEAPISVTMSAAPATNSRIDLIVAYVDNPPQGSATSIDNPGACGLITVDGTAAADPVAPNDSAIRTAITADGASGSTAYYVVLATLTIASGTTDLTSDNIAAGPSAGIGSQNVDFTTFVVSGIKFVSKSNISVPSAWTLTNIDSQTITLPTTGKWLVVGGTSFTDFGQSSEFRLTVTCDGVSSYETQYVCIPLQGLTNSLVFNATSPTIEIRRSYNGGGPDSGKIRIGETNLVLIRIG